ncbi:MAG: hypothetical protein DBX59_00370 [Bacillota bacterium]|nr:MAG: hypothetical protein DBX59_00370 [Bacillota bacterium]
MSKPDREGKGIRRSRIVYLVVAIFILSVFALIQIFPFWVKLVDSFMEPGFIGELGKIYLFPPNFSFENYVGAWERVDMLGGFINSIYYTAVYLLLSTVIIILMGYALSKKKFHGRNLIFMLLIATMMVPGEVLLVSLYGLVNAFNMQNTPAAIFLPGIINILGIFLAKQFMDSIPDSLIEAAKIDGASEFRVIWQIVVPMSRPILASYIIITAVAQWNDYLWPMTVLRDSKLFTVQLKLRSLTSSMLPSQFERYKSAGVMSTVLPVIVVYAIFQKQFIQGISVSGLK